jgi:hypothetical protein
MEVPINRAFATAAPFPMLMIDRVIELSGSTCSPRS